MSDFRYVLWVRHCYACHNMDKNSLSKVRSGTESNKRAYKVDSYCTNPIGERQSFEFGIRYKKKIFEKLNQKLKNLSHNELQLPDKFKLYSSALPRAMETAKLISGGIIKAQDLQTSQPSGDFEEVSLEDDEIERINYIQEINDGNWLSAGGDYVNTITRKNSDKAVRILNEVFNKPKYYDISEKIVKSNPNDDPIDYFSTDPNFLRKIQINAKINYDNFKKYILPDLPHDKLNIIISHSNFLKQALNFSNKMENLDAYLIVYENKPRISDSKLKVDSAADGAADSAADSAADGDADGAADGASDGDSQVYNYEEDPKYRMLYLFAENEIITPETDGRLKGKLVPPLRETRSEDVKILNDKLLSGESYKPEKSHKYHTIGSCLTKEITEGGDDEMAEGHDDEIAKKMAAKTKAKEAVEVKVLNDKLAAIAYRGGNKLSKKKISKNKISKKKTSKKKYKK